MLFSDSSSVRYGARIFGWHGCVMLEQPPFSLQSAFNQRYRWIVGVLQGLELLRRLPAFVTCPFRLAGGCSGERAIVSSPLPWAHLLADCRCSMCSIGRSPSSVDTICSLCQCSCNGGLPSSASSGSTPSPLEPGIISDR